MQQVQDAVVQHCRQVEWHNALYFVVVVLIANGYMQMLLQNHSQMLSTGYQVWSTF